MKPFHHRLKLSQRGFVLLDALIAILIFSIGILGMVALQGTAIKLSGDAQNRSNAAMFADQIIAPMWGNSPAELTNLYAGSGGTGGTAYVSWVNSMDCAHTPHVVGCLPGVAANPPTIVVDSSATVPGTLSTSLVTVTVRWQSPNDTGPHNYVSITQISL